MAITITSGEAIMSQIKAQAIKELKAQGHYLTGYLESSLEIKVIEKADGLLGRLIMDDSGDYLNRGIAAKDIKFKLSKRGKKGSKGSGKTSKYIQALKEYFEKRGFDSNKALKLSFATARIAKKTGHPTPGAFSFTSNGRRLNWIQNSIPDNIDGIVEENIFRIYSAALEDVMQNATDKKANTNSKGFIQKVYTEILKNLLKMIK